MQLIPAIDLLNGEVVRLHQGAFNDSKSYNITPLQLAKNYAEAGASWLHIVDLAASRDGEASHPELVLQLLQNAPQSVQIGGGIRTGEDIRHRLDCGAERVVVGTICVSQPARFLEWLDEFGNERIVSALDVVMDSDGVPRPRTHGWTQSGEQTLWELLDEFTSHGLRHLLCTDISKDGALKGPNFELYRELTGRYPDLQVQASGGVSGLRDLERLKTTGASAAITGKALLEACFTVQEALAVLAV